MTEQTLSRPASFFNEKHSLLIRIWHWTTFLLFFATLTTVLLASTLFTTRSNIKMVQEQVQSKGGSVTADQARSVAHEYSDKLWNTHKIIGYVLCFSLLSRILIEVSQSKEEKISARFKHALDYSSKKTNPEGDHAHYLLVNRGYILFYILFLVMALTGLVLAFEDVEFLKPIHKASNSIHSFTQYLIYFYILAHIVGVIRADIGRNKGIISGMINGG